MYIIALLFEQRGSCAQCCSAFFVRSRVDIKGNLDKDIVSVCVLDKGNAYIFIVMRLKLRFNVLAARMGTALYNR